MTKLVNTILYKVNMAVCAKHTERSIYSRIRNNIQRNIVRIWRP